MKALAAFALALTLGGCATDNEDRAFFDEGWLKPEEGATRRLYRNQMPVNAEKERKLDER